MRPFPFYLLFGLGIGFYDGFFGPGTGSFWALAFVLCLGQELRKATASTKVMNFTSNILSLAVFLAMGNVHFVPGLVMAGGQFLGGRLGARLVLTRGAKLVRPGADVWIVYGDGSAGYSLAEADTFAGHGLGVVALIGNDAGWTQIAREAPPAPPALRRRSRGSRWTRTRPCRGRARRRR